MLTKRKIRSTILSKLRRQKEEVRREKSEVIRRALFRLKVFKEAKIIMFYISLRGEVETGKMIQHAQAQGKRIAVPVCTKNRKIRPNLLSEKARLTKGPYGVYEPVHKSAVSLKDITLVIVPGLAFDKKGNRLGRGRGYYDRFLSRLPEHVTSVGLAFDFQILPFIPTQSTDVRVHKLIFA